ncbi:MAG: serine hydrolase domain-containing protein [Terracidiphilus sp.]
MRTISRRFAVGKVLLTVVAAMFALASAVSAQQSPKIAGDYAGVIGTQQTTLHLKIDADGALKGTLDHLDPRSPWMFWLSGLQLQGQSLSFSIPEEDVIWKGTVSSDGESLTGIWTERGGSGPVNFLRQRFVPASKPSPVDGIWLGVTPIAANESTRVQIVVNSDSSGREFCTMDVLDTHYMDLQCANVAFKGDDFSFDIPAGGEHWSGKLSADGKTLTGNMSAKQLTDKGSQEIVQPMNFARQAALTAEKPIPAPTYDAAMPPVSAADLQSVLDRDLAGALKSGELAPATGSGVSIAVYEHGVTRVFSYGTAKPDSIFEIGSITKTFTGLMLSQMAMQGKVKLDEPVRELLPPGTVAKPEGPEITLLDLATRRSGLPPMPDNINLANMDNPYADYHAADLLAYIGKHGVANPARVSSPFGSLGFGLLGVALANRAGSSYAALLKDEIADPLGLKDTTVTLSPGQQLRLIAGHDQFHGPAKAWDTDALAGAIGIRSTAGDLLAYLEANLHPESLKPVAGSAGSATLASALRQALQPQSEVSPGMRIALGWLYQEETGNFWHNGATAAYSSYAFFNPKGDYAAVVLLNASPGVNGSLVEVLGRHISQRLAGKPAISLAN